MDDEQFYLSLYFLFLFLGFLSVQVSVKRIKLQFNVKIFSLYGLLVFKENLTYSVTS